MGQAEGVRAPPTKEAPEDIKAEHEAFHKELIEAVTQLFQRVSQGEGFNLKSLDALVARSLEAQGVLDFMYGKALALKDTTNAMGIHLVNVFTFSLKLGQGLRYSFERQRRLGTAALIHDLGMCRVPQEYRHKEGSLATRELDEIRRHPIYGYELVLENLGNDYRWLAETLLQEHERERGQGYPHGLAGDKIGEFAKVIGLADVYEALSQPRPYRGQLLPYRVVQEILQNMRGFFSPKVLKAMLSELSVFALHSLVRLNSNAIGQVVEIVAEHPLRPTIELLYDAEGYRIRDRRVIHLKDSPLLYIVDSVDESELPAD
ncbi:MAG: HD-GYP domain-containing protein [Nitrospinota bacterium]